MRASRVSRGRSYPRSVMAGDFNLLEAQRAVFMSDLTSVEKLVALALLNHWSRARETFPSVDRLAKWTSLGRRTVIRSLGTLEAKRAIAVTRSHGRANRYELGPLMNVTSATVAPVPEGHQCQAGTPPVPEGHPTSATVAPEVIQGSDPKKGSKKTARARGPRKPQIELPLEDPIAKAWHQEITKIYFELYEAARGQKPPFDGRDGKAVGELLKKCGRADSEHALRSAFADTWWRSKITIRTIASEPAKFIGLRSAVAGGQGVRAGDLLNRQMQRVAELEASERAERALP
jgi:Helix-turn-helix domain